MTARPVMAGLLFATIVIAGVAWARGRRRLSP